MSAFGEFRGGQEGQVAYVRRRKAGLETPLVGRFYRENAVLVFAPPLWYDMLVGMCILAGAALAVWYHGQDSEFQWVCVAVFFAGIWGAISNERMVCNVKQRTYARYEGMGFGKRLIRGSLADLDALVLTAEQYAHGTGFTPVVIYRLVLYWKGMRQPPVVAEREKRSIQSGAPLNQAAGLMLQRGALYAQALQVRYFDNFSYAWTLPDFADLEGFWGQYIPFCGVPETE